jgi:hypothetical protein
MQRHEMEAWLGDDHGLTGEQVDDLITTAEDIAVRYPEDDDADLRRTALSVAHRAMREGVAVVDELAKQLADARHAQVVALAGLRQASRSLIPYGDETESGFARRAGVDRMAVRGWLGKR